MAWRALALAAIVPVAASPAPSHSTQAEPATTVHGTGATAGAIEAALIARHPGVARRRGATLTVGHRTYRTVKCGNDRPDRCAEYTLDAVFPGGIVGIGVTYYESRDYLLTDGIAELPVGNRPLLSPDRRHLLAAHFSEVGHEPAKGVTLIVLAAEELGEPLTPVRYISPHALANYEHVRWLGPSCAGFVAADTRTGWGEGKGHRWYLVEDRPEWRLTAMREPVCGTAG